MGWFHGSGNIIHRISSQKRLALPKFMFSAILSLYSHQVEGQVGSEGWWGIPENYIYGVDAYFLLNALETDQSSDGFSILYTNGDFDLPFLSAEWGGLGAAATFYNNSRMETRIQISSIEANEICFNGAANFCVQLFLGPKRFEYPGGIYCMSQSGTNFSERMVSCRFVSYRSGRDGFLPADMSGYCIHRNDRDGLVKAEPVRCGTGYVRRQSPASMIVSDTGRWQAEERFIRQLE